MTTTAHHRTAYRPDIDGLRAIAVGIVVLFHAFPRSLSGGFIGVDVFFVISGYLISGILFSEIRSKSYSILRFYYRRIRRIFPALLLVMAVSFVYAHSEIHPHQFVEVSKHLAAGAGFVSNLLLWSEAGYFDQSIDLKPLMHLWSLGVEEQYYLVWPLLLLVTLKTNDRFRQIMILSLIVLSFGYSLYQLSTDPTGAFYSPLARFWELLIGAFLASLSKARLEAIPIGVRNVASVAGVAAIAIGSLLLDSKSQFPGFWALLPTVGAFLIIFAGAESWFNRVVLGSRLFVAVGLISYPLYLWHWPILSFLRIRFGDPNYLQCGLAVLASVAAAAATYWFVEKPLRRAKSELLVPILFGLMALMLVVSLSVIQFGILIRPLTLRDRLQEPYETAEIYRYKTCFLYPATQSEADFAPECDPVAAPHQKRVLIWGDSLAAQLYSGLNALNGSIPGKPLAITQRTAGSCPPGLDIDHSENGHCDSINAATRAYILDQHPDIVVLNGRWWNNGRSPAERLPDVVSFLKNAGVKTVVILGPAPDWWPDLRRLLMGVSLENGVPERMALPRVAWKKTLEQDKEIRDITSSLPVAYVSLVDQFCQSDQCLVRVKDDPINGLITSDHDHMTEAASVFLFSRPVIADLFLK